MYKVREGIVSRNIGNLFFLVDIKDKKCYDIKKMYSVNEIGKFLFDTMNKKEKFLKSEIIDELILILNNYTDDLKTKIELDVEDFLNDLLRVGYILEAE